MIVSIEGLKKNSRVLVHSCCAACYFSLIKNIWLASRFQSIYFYNPNIHPYSEYLKRREALLATLAHEKIQAEFIPGAYDFRDFFSTVSGSDSYPQRCRFCYRLRLHETARLAAEKGFDYFTTTVLASPYQSRELVLEEASRAAETFDLAFVDYKIDKNEYRKSIEEFKKLGLYYQKYCGCLYSEVERQGR